jgi:hypothetical protein
MQLSIGFVSGEHVYSVIAVGVNRINFIKWANIMKAVNKPEVNKKRERETAEYLAEMMLELRSVAKAANLLTLTGLLEIAYYEAFTVANRVELPPGEVERLKNLEKATAA